MCMVWHFAPCGTQFHSGSRTLARLWDTSSSSRRQACSAGRQSDCAINKSNSAGDISTGDTGVQEYRVSGVQGYQRFGHIIITNMLGNTGVRYHVSSITCQVPVLYIMCQVYHGKYRCLISSVKYNMASTGVGYHGQIQHGKYRCHISSIKYSMASIRCIHVRIR